MKFLGIYCLIIFFFVFAVNLAKGSEKWSEERSKILKNFVDVNRKIKSKDEEFDLFKNKVLDLVEKNKNDIDELHGLLERKQSKIDQLENNESINEQELQKLRIQVQEMTIQGIEIHR